MLNCAKAIDRTKEIAKPAREKQRLSRGTGTVRHLMHGRPAELVDELVPWILGTLAGTLRVSVLDVGQGDSILIQSPTTR